MELINTKCTKNNENEIITMDIKENQDIIANVQILRELSDLNQNQNDYVIRDGLNSLTRMTNYPYKHLIVITTNNSNNIISEISRFLYPIIGIIPTYTLSENLMNVYSANVIVDYDILSRTIEILEANQVEVERTSINEENKHRI